MTRGTTTARRTPREAGEDPLLTFALIGPGKSGTTWAFEVLSAHPDVCMASAKETMFFDENCDRDVAWFHGLFAPRPGVKAIGEASNTYLSAPQAPPRMAAYNPSLRLVASLRDPIDRAFSNYLFFLRNGQYRGSFEEVLDKRPDLLDQGRYGWHLARYRQHFPAEQILVLAYDDLVRDSTAYARRLLAFIGADPGIVPRIAGEHVLAASLARSRQAARVTKAGALLARRVGAPQLVTRVKRSGLHRLLYRPYEADDRPRVSPTTRTRLEEFYAADVALLYRLTGRDWGSMWGFGVTA